MTIFPVTESTISAKDLGQFLREKYDLSERTNFKLFRTGMNHLYFVVDGDKKFAFRIYTFNWRSKIDIAEELRLLIHLKLHDASISYPITDKQNELIQEISAGSLKVKLAGSLVGISGIYLLQTFINIKNQESEHVMWQVIIHVVFLFSALMLAYTERNLHQKH